jgi:hypothetical protein
MGDPSYLLGRIEQETIELPYVVNGRFADDHGGSSAGGGSQAASGGCKLRLDDRTARLSLSTRSVFISTCIVLRGTNIGL